MLAASCVRTTLKQHSVMAGLVPAIHVLLLDRQERRGCPSIRAFTPVFDGLWPGMTEFVELAHHVSLNSSSPSFSIDVTTVSPGLSQTCLSFGLPAITPSGVPVKMISPGLRVK